MTPDQAKLVQKRLSLVQDGVLGQISYAAIFRYVARRDGPTFGEFGKGAALHFPKYQVTTPLRLAHWLGQMAHESAGFFYLKELGGDKYFFNMYDKDGARPASAAKLGNSEPGDGARYCGRSLVQITGRFNYRKCGERIGLDLEGNPELASDPANAVLIACDYWQSRKINQLADADDIVAVSKAVNGGLNGLEDRKMYTNRARGILL